MNIIRIEISRIELSQRQSLSVAQFIKDIHMRTISADPLRVLLIIRLEKLRLGTQTVIFAKLRDIIGVLDALLEEVFFFLSHGQRDLHALEEYVHDALLEVFKIRISDRAETVLYCFRGSRASAAFRRNKIRMEFFSKAFIRMSDLILELVISNLAELIPASGNRR